MAQIQNLVLTDRETTPVAHTFTPRDVTGNVGTVQESTGVKVGDKTYSISVRKTPSGIYKVVVKFVVPVVVTETINGVSVPKVARTSYVTTECSFDKESTVQERKNVIGMFADSLGASQVIVNDALVNLNPVY